jgi:hypothetical protein
MKVQGKDLCRITDVWDSSAGHEYGSPVPTLHSPRCHTCTPKAHSTALGVRRRAQGGTRKVSKEAQTSDTATRGTQPCKVRRNRPTGHGICSQALAAGAPPTVSQEVHLAPEAKAHAINVRLMKHLLHKAFTHA